MSRTQPERIRRLAIQRGPEGVSQVDFDKPAVDGGPPIPQIARRIHDLHKQGVCRFVDGGERNGFKVYVLDAFAPKALEHFRTGWLCLACGAQHPAAALPMTPGVARPCPRCGGFPLLHARVVECIVNTTHQEAA